MKKVYKQASIQLQVCARLLKRRRDMYLHDLSHEHVVGIQQSSRQDQIRARSGRTILARPLWTTINSNRDLSSCLPLMNFGRLFDPDKMSIVGFGQHTMRGNSKQSDGRCFYFSLERLIILIDCMHGLALVNGSSAKRLLLVLLLTRVTHHWSQIQKLLQYELAS